MSCRRVHYGRRVENLSAFGGFLYVESYSGRRRFWVAAAAFGG
jgi:hypothetical protein